VSEVVEFAVSVRAQKQRSKMLSASLAFGESADNELLLWSSFDL
jgi:hypothetical protein